MLQQDRKEPDIKPVSRRAATIANLIHQYITTGIAIVNGIVLVPLYLKYIDFKLYGAWLASGSIIGWLGMVDAGLNEIIRQQTAVAYGSRDIAETGRVMTTGMICNAAVGIVPAVVGTLIAPFLGTIFSLEPAMVRELIYSFVCVALSCSFVIIGGAACAGLQGLQRNVSVCVIFVFSSLMGIILTIWMLLKGYSVVSLPAGLLARGVLWTILYWGYLYYLSYFRLGIHWHFSKKHFSKIVSLTSWTFLYKLFFEIVSQSDGLVVGLILGVEATPVFVLTRRSWDLLQTFLTRVGVAFMPALAHLHGEGSREKFAVISQRLLNTCIYATIIGAGTCVVLNSSFVQLWVGQSLYAGKFFDVVMGAGMLATIYNWSVNSVIYARGIIIGPAVVGIVQSIARAIVLIAAVWFWHIIGTALSVAIVGIAVAPYFLTQLNRVLVSCPTKLQNITYIRFIATAVVVISLSAFLSSYIVLNSWIQFVFIGMIYFLLLTMFVCIIDKQFRSELTILLFAIPTRVLRRWRITAD
jgi:O-antigen/teichoic acid export membrane protein